MPANDTTGYDELPTSPDEPDQPEQQDDVEDADA